MIDISGILGLSFIRVCRLHLEDIKLRYRHPGWMKLFTDQAELELRAAVNEILGSDYDGRKGRRTISSGMLISLLKDLSHKIDASDLLFFKALFTNSDEDTVFFLEQAQMISPENLRFHIMRTFIALDEDTEPEELIAHLRSLTELSAEEDVRNFTSLVEIMHCIDGGGEEIDPRETARFLNRVQLPHAARYALLYYIQEKSSGEAVEQLLYWLEYSDKEDHWVYKLARFNSCFDMGEYGSALEWFRVLDIASHNMDYYMKLELDYKMAVILRHTGNEGKGILQLRELVYSEESDGCLTDAYICAVIDLTYYYIKLQNTEEAERVFSKLPAEMMDYAEVLMGETFLLLMADRCMLSYDMASALKYYKKAYELNSRPETEEKIRQLENGQDYK